MALLEFQKSVQDCVSRLHGELERHPELERRVLNAMAQRVLERSKERHRELVDRRNLRILRELAKR